MIGKTLSHYEILEEISRGGMGIVYRARDLRLERQVALKVLPPELVKEADRRRRFVEEARATASLEHPHIGVIHEIDEDADTIFIAMEHIQGDTLSHAMEKSGFSLSRSLELSAQIAAGLAHAHNKGIVHRDLKPSNIMLTELGYPKLIDFGLAKLLDAEKSPFLGQASEEESALRSDTREGVIVGTATSMSPEQARGGKVDYRSDVFAFGLLIYHLVGGEPPFHGSTRLDTLHSILRDPTPDLPELKVPSEIREQLQTIINGCLEKDPGKRYQSMTEVESDLRRVRLQLESTEMRPASPPPKSGSARLWRYALASLATVTLVVALVRWFSSPVAVVPADEKPYLAVMHFTNLSGEQELDWLRAGLADMLVTDLSQAPDIELIGSDRLQQVLEESRRADGDQLTAEAIERLADQTNVNTLLMGSFAKLGDTIRLSARLQDVDSGVVLASEKVEGVGEQSVFRLVDDLSRKIHSHLRREDSTESPLEAAHELDRDLKEVTTASLEAYRHYAEGIRLHELYREEESIPHFERAVEIDPGFAMALAKLGVVNANLGREEESSRYAEQALQHLERASARERFYIQGWAYSRSPETVNDAIDAYRQAVAMYPDHASARHNLANLLLKLENYDEAIEHLERLRRMGAPFAQTWEQLADSHVLLGEFDEAEEVLLEYLDRRPESYDTRVSLARIRTLNGNYSRATTLLAEAEQLGAKQGDVDSVRFLAHLLDERWDEAEELATRYSGEESGREQFLWGRNLSLVALYQGHSESVLDGLERFLSSLGDELTYASGPMTFLAMLHIDRGEYDDAREVSDRLKELGAYGRVNGTFIQILADEHLGEPDRADETLAGYRTSLEQVFGRGAERIHFLLDGKLKIHRRQFDEAITSLTEAESLLPPKGPEALHSTIWFALAEAHRKASDESEAIRWYRRITQARLERLYDPVSYVRSYYFLGVLYESEGEPERALSSYRRFVDYWGGGDIDRPRLRNARERIAKLEQG